MCIKKVNGKVIINHVDAKGQPVGPPDIVTGPVGSNYTSDNLKKLVTDWRV